MYYANKCCNGVRWKKSTINFRLHQFSIVASTCYNIKNGCYNVGKTYRFIINERGKIEDRLVHEIISNEILSPIYEPHLIYDNGASQKEKGFIFALYRVKNKLQKYYKLNKNNGYVVLVDYSKFFENCSHEIIHNIHKKYIKNEEVIKVIEDYLFIGNGIALGVEIAQREASMVPNVLDHYIENKFMIERYMDDTCYICRTYEEANNSLNYYRSKASDYGIIVNPNKTKMIKLKNRFKYCKWIYKKSIYRQRRKLRKKYNLCNIKKISYEDLKISKQSFKDYLNLGNSYRYIK